MSTVTEPHPTLAAALLAFQAEAITLQTTAINKAFKKEDGSPSKYVPLDGLMTVVLPKLNAHGLVWVTLPNSGHNGDGPCLGYRLIHAASGEQIEGAMPLSLPATANPQQQGSAITYARRYSMMAVLGLVAERDDDGQRAGRQPAAAALIPKAQQDILKDAARDLKPQQIKMVLAAHQVAPGKTVATAFANVPPGLVIQLCEELIAVKR